MQRKAEQGKAKQSNAKQCKAMQGKAMQSKAKQCKAMQSDAKQCKAMQSNAKQCKAKQCKAKRSNAKPSNAKRCKAMQSKQSKADQSKAMQDQAKQSKDIQNNGCLQQCFEYLCAKKTILIGVAPGSCLFDVVLSFVCFVSPFVLSVFLLLCRSVFLRRHHGAWSLEGWSVGEGFSELPVSGLAFWDFWGSPRLSLLEQTEGHNKIRNSMNNKIHISPHPKRWARVGQMGPGDLSGGMMPSQAPFRRLTFPPGWKRLSWLMFSLFWKHKLQEKCSESGLTLGLLVSTRMKLFGATSCTGPFHHWWKGPPALCFHKFENISRQKNVQMPV